MNEKSVVIATEVISRCLSSGEKSFSDEREICRDCHRGHLSLFVFLGEVIF